MWSIGCLKKLFFFVCLAYTKELFVDDIEQKQLVLSTDLDHFKMSFCAFGGIQSFIVYYHHPHYFIVYHQMVPILVPIADGNNIRNMKKICYVAISMDPLPFLFPN